MTSKLRNNLGAALLTAAGCLAGASVLAADDGGQFAVKGAGTATCERYVKAVEERGPALASFGGWVEGYLTAVNQYTKETFDLVSFETSESLALALINHCKKHPKKSFLLANREMLAALYKQRLTQKSPLKKAAGEPGGKGVYLYEETIRRVQQRLTALELYGGPIDGDYNDGTRAAIKEFKSKRGLTPDAVPSQKTLQHLFRGQ